LASETRYKRTIIRAFSSKAHLVRQVAMEQGVSYEETPVPGEDDVVRFVFKTKDDAATDTLVTALPREVFVRRAVMGGIPPFPKDSE
jgi:hypothetical protein